MDFHTVLAIITALGGFEAFKWAINSWRNRRTDARKQETAADSDEFHLLREQIEFLQTQLKDKELRFAEQTELVRRQNTDIINLTKEKAALELDLSLCPIVRAAFVLVLCSLLIFDIYEYTKRNSQQQSFEYTT